MSDTREHILIGLPETGKTTFLAALWHVLCSEDIDTALTLSRYHDDHGYLNRIRERWVNAEVQDRTIPSSESKVSMLLTWKDSESELEVCIPDLSGESYESAWSYRKINAERADVIARAEGILLFISPDRVESEVLISATTSIIEGLDDNEDADEVATEVIEWDAHKAPTQIQLVDLLQSVLRLNDTRPLSIGVVVSAWDRVEISRELPLLHQFLLSNDDTLRVAFFGISAQGGSLPHDADRLREVDQPTERIQVLCDDGQTNSDITTPLRWLMTAVNQ
jgi:hypothetical protein